MPVFILPLQWNISWLSSILKFLSLPITVLRILGSPWLGRFAFESVPLFLLSFFTSQLCWWGIFVMDDGKLWNRFWVFELSLRLLSPANVFWLLCFAGVLSDGKDGRQWLSFILRFLSKPPQFSNKLLPSFFANMLGFFLLMAIFFTTDLLFSLQLLEASVLQRLKLVHWEQGMLENEDVAVVVKKRKLLRGSTFRPPRPAWKGRAFWAEKTWLLSLLQAQIYTP